MPRSMGSQKVRHDCATEQQQQSKIYKKLLKFNNKKTTWLINESKIWIVTTLKKIYRWPISIWNNVPHLRSSGNCKWKQRDSTTHLLEWPKSKPMTKPRYLVGIPNSTDTERQFGKHTPAMIGGCGLGAKFCLTLATPWTVANQAPLALGFSRQEY